MPTSRMFGSRPLTKDDLLRFKAFTPEMLALMEGAMKARLNVIISGGTGSGKTTLLNTLSSFIQTDHRVLTIEAQMRDRATTKDSRYSQMAAAAVRFSQAEMAVGNSSDSGSGDE